MKWRSQLRSQEPKHDNNKNKSPQRHEADRAQDFSLAQAAHPIQPKGVSLFYIPISSRRMILSAEAWCRRFFAPMAMAYQRVGFEWERGCSRAFTCQGGITYGAWLVSTHVGLGIGWIFVMGFGLEHCWRGFMGLLHF